MTFYGDEGKKVIEHVQRPPLPWRPPALVLTECGLSISGPMVLTREAFMRKVKEQGRQRAAMSTCMTCFDTALRHPAWQEDPVGCPYRETSGYRVGQALFRKELRALGALVARHSDEFTELMKDQDEIVPLASAKPKKRTSTGTKW